MAVTWDSSYETGDPSIDLQHRELLAIVDELEAAEAERHHSHEAILRVLGHVMDFALSHFLMEEELMVQVGYPSPAVEEMVEQHREFTSYSRLRVLEFRAGELGSVLPLQAFLADWLVVHEFGLDRYFADFLRERGRIRAERDTA
jgi:hemerythrin-like metal-binding protein